MKHLGILGLLLALTSCDVVDIVGTMNSTKDIHSAVNATVSHDVIFDANGGTGTMASQTIGVGKTAKLSLFTAGTITRVGYAFGGWVLDKTSTTADYEDGTDYTMGTADVTLYALWSGSPSSAKDITAFSFVPKAMTNNPTTEVTGTIVGNNITVALLSTTSRNNMVATFTTTGTAVKVGTVVQTSGTTANDFSSTVTYVVSALDGTTKSYSVTVTTPTTYAYITTGASGTKVFKLLNSQTDPLAIVSNSTNIGALAPVADPKGRALYVYDSGPKTLAAYTITTTSGALTSQGTPQNIGGTTNTQVQNPLVDPLGRFVYVIQQETTSVGYTVFKVASDGKLGTGSNGATGISSPGPMAITADGKYVYIADISTAATAQIYAFSIDATSGALNRIVGGESGLLSASTGTAPEKMVLSPNGKFLIATSNWILSVLSIQPDGKLSPVDSNDFSTSAGSPQQFLISPSGDFILNYNGYASYDYRFWGMNADTGALTTNGTNFNSYGGPTKLLFHPSLSIVYFINGNRIHPFNFSSAPIFSAQATGYPQAYTGHMAIDSQGTYLLATNATNLFAYPVSSSTGALTTSGVSGQDIGGGVTSITLVEVP